MVGHAKLLHSCCWKCAKKFSLVITLLVNIPKIKEKIIDSSGGLLLSLDQYIELKEMDKGIPFIKGTGMTLEHIHESGSDATSKQVSLLQSHIWKNEWINKYVNNL